MDNLSSASSTHSRRDSGAAPKASPLRQTIFVSLLVVVYGIWASLLFTGHLVLFEYEMTEGPLGNSKRIFPEKSSVQLTHGRQNIILFLHPACPCSAASVDEFHELIREGENDSVGKVVFFMPPDQESEWSLLPLISSVKRIPHVSVSYDTNGAQAELFGATTSGHVFIYDGRGILQFSGGITGSRGHTGDNKNLEIAKNTIIARSPKFATTPVFGCSLRETQ
jgi:hypothetical protein